jgi:hypothetical protein
VPSSWSWTSLNLVLSHFSELSHLGDFVANWSSLLVMNLKLFTNVFMKLNTPPSLHGLQLMGLDTINKDFIHHEFHVGIVTLSHYLF